MHVVSSALKESMLKKRKLPVAKEIETKVLEALRELGGEARYDCINDLVRDKLKPHVYVGQSNKKAKSFYGMKLGVETARARTELRKRNRIRRGSKRGYWVIQRNVPAGETTSIGRVSDFAHKAIYRLRKMQVSPDAINMIRELFLEYQAPEAHPDTTANKLAVEEVAIKYILSKERGPPQRSALANDGVDVTLAETDMSEATWPTGKPSSPQ